MAKINFDVKKALLEDLKVHLKRSPGPFDFEDGECEYLIELITKDIEEQAYYEF